MTRRNSAGTFLLCTGIAACGTPISNNGDASISDGVVAIDGVSLDGSTSDAAADVASDATSDVMSDAAADVASDATSDATSDVMSDGGADGSIPMRATNKLDLVVVVDNSGSMAENQANLMAQLAPLVGQLSDPPCVLRSAPQVPRRCDPMNPDLVPVHRPVVDLRVGVISTDLGTPRSMIPGCDDSEIGDDGRLNPIRFGDAMQTHLPWAPRRPNAVTAPAAFRPLACSNDVGQFPAFITFCSNTADASCDVAGVNASSRNASTFADWFQCNAGIFINGCGLESPLEALWRGLVEHAARAPMGSGVNAGFLRDDAVLGILILTDEEDGSVRNCAHDNGFSNQGGGACLSGTDVYNYSSLAWAHPASPDLRFYLYTPGDSRDPTWNLDRYVNTAAPGVVGRWTRDLFSLKPGHPERIVFAAITGVPLVVPMRGENTDWNALLGAVGTNGPNDFYGRDSSRAVSGVQDTAGPFSMRQANMDPSCAHVVPACRRQGTTFDASRSCSNSQYMAFPSRRIVEVARRFDEVPLCSGQPCRNGIVSSICSSNLSATVTAIARRMGTALGR